MSHGTDRRALGRRIAALREARNLTQLQLAVAAAIQPSTLSRIENGHHRPHPGVLRNLANALQVGVADLERGDGERAEIPP